jgi:hypothetical protein
MKSEATMIQCVVTCIGTVILYTFLLMVAFIVAATPRIETGFLDQEVTLGGIEYRYLENGHQK